MMPGSGIDEGEAGLLDWDEARERLTARTSGFLDPAVNATVRLPAEWIFALNEESFTKSPTKWEVSP
jgi:hypothetical protein